jgi:prepilin-type N-terminal cleavage/methylation domain-containing protein
MKSGIPRTTPRGMSMVEILVSIAIVAILTTLAIPTYMGYFSSSKTTIAGSLLETLNTAVHRFNEGNYELVVTPGMDTQAQVELAVLRTLQYRNPLNPKVGSPYIHTRWNPVASSDTADYRLQWKGTLFVLLAPGTAGTGLKVDFKSADLGTPYVFPSDFTMAGS